MVDPKKLAQAAKIIRRVSPTGTVYERPEKPLGNALLGAIGNQQSLPENKEFTPDSSFDLPVDDEPEETPASDIKINPRPKNIDDVIDIKNPEYVEDEPLEEIAAHEPLVPPMPESHLETLKKLQAAANGSLAKEVDPKYQDIFKRIAAASYPGQKLPESEIGKRKEFSTTLSDNSHPYTDENNSVRYAETASLSRQLNQAARQMAHHGVKVYLRGKNVRKVNIHGVYYALSSVPNELWDFINEHSEKPPSFEIIQTDYKPHGGESRHPEIARFYGEPHWEKGKTAHQLGSLSSPFTYHVNENNVLKHEEVGPANMAHRQTVAHTAYNIGNYLTHALERASYEKPEIHADLAEIQKNAANELGLHNNSIHAILGRVLQHYIMSGYEAQNEASRDIVGGMPLKDDEKDKQLVSYLHTLATKGGPAGHGAPRVAAALSHLFQHIGVPMKDIMARTAAGQSRVQTVDNNITKEHIKNPEFRVGEPEETDEYNKKLSDETKAITQAAKLGKALAFSKTARPEAVNEAAKTLATLPPGLREEVAKVYQAKIHDANHPDIQHLLDEKPDTHRFPTATSDLTTGVGEEQDHGNSIIHHILHPLQNRTSARREIANTVSRGIGGAILDKLLKGQITPEQIEKGEIPTANPAYKPFYEKVISDLYNKGSADRVLDAIKKRRDYKTLAAAINNDPRGNKSLTLAARLYARNMFQSLFSQLHNYIREETKNNPVPLAKKLAYTKFFANLGSQKIDSQTGALFKQLLESHPNIRQNLVVGP